MKDDSMPKDTQENDSEKQKFNWKEELIRGLKQALRTYQMQCLQGYMKI